MDESLGIRDFVNAFVPSHEVAVLKPEPEIYQRTLERLELKASECIYIGDGDDRELDGARKEGIYTIRINRPRPPYTNPKKESLDWDSEVDSLKEIKSLFQ